MDRQAVAAFLLDCKPAEFLSYKDYGEDGFVAIAPDGSKHIFDLEQLEKGELAMNTPTLKEAAAAAAEPAQAPAEKRKPRTSTKRRTTKK